MVGEGEQAQTRQPLQARVDLLRELEASRDKIVAASAPGL
jgi:hypothetical protein